MSEAAPRDFAIETHGLIKRFGHRSAVEGIDLAVPRGSVYGFLGPNGSGKTTTIRVLLGLASASSGEIRVLGQDMPKSLAVVLPEVGALVEGPGFYPFLSGRGNLMRLDSADRHASSSTRRQRVNDALERVGLGHAAAKKVRTYSLGMKQRLGLANAMLRPRELLVLDEPTNGLDPQGTREVRSLVRSLAAGGTTVFVSSHLLAEVEQMCTDVGVMSAGRLVAQGPLEELRSAGQARVVVQTPDAERASSVLARLGLVPGDAPGTVSRPGTTALLGTGLSGLAPEAIVAALVEGGVRVRGFAVENASLEERFVSLTGEGFDVVG
ncbi:ABC-2 type transport system ATP-binding protein [Paenarthrobacter nicotinovorans]|uniref:ABC transporter ATP-binding protein n=1 Tax=Micrococcaceae TaxID=1268 RepID=UPI0008769835|nr:MULTISPECIES: ABC transporter ATP-binding protein [Micrococcaceae]MDR6436458.1 ABC-2 type transport system ATP-binding protein [Paenarthrobacter nicotinovorans]BCW58818.1 ABC transporter ATP-binding protein [Arthrobacter sp. StoSoilB20]SCZ57656.1 ABC-2 type transport system ATP-binding protein [Arthrobacter sp. UNCCL28]